MFNDTKSDKLGTPLEIAERLKEIFGMQGDNTPPSIPLTPGYALEYNTQFGFHRLKGDLSNIVNAQEAVREAAMIGITVKEMTCPDGNQRYVAERAGVQRYFAIERGDYKLSESFSKPPTFKL